MEFIKRNTDYALRALVYLAQKEPETVVDVHTIAEQGQVSEDFLRKILQVLGNAGIVRSHRGPRGGFSLARSAADITILDVMEALQGPVAINRCFLGRDRCANLRECDLRNRLVDVQDTIVEFLNDIDLAKLASAERLV